MIGKVRFFNKEKGFGFIESEGKDYFVHFTAIKNGKNLIEGQSVSFVLGHGKKGPIASDVIIS